MLDLDIKFTIYCEFVNEEWREKREDSVRRVSAIYDMRIDRIMKSNTKKVVLKLLILSATLSKVCWYYLSKSWMCKGTCELNL